MIQPDESIPSCQDNAGGKIRLLTGNVEVLDLTVGNAMAAGRYSANLAVGHVSVEGHDTGGTIITARPLDYDPSLRVREFRSL